MAFDQSTRGRLQKLVNSCRGLLSDEFSIQLQQTYGLDPKTGEVTPMTRLTHLDDRQRHTAEVLRQTLSHYLGADADDTKHRIAVLDRMVREQAFTVLNRLAALLMMEARGQFPRIEILSKGYQSSGYQLYSKIAGTALGETGLAYQVYLFSVFDELAQELPALFDRYAANGLLFPRESALRALLDELNHFEIEPLWGEDETIGWIYQYFNSKEERKAMRDASQAPRNSRELAVRNQFFTPRYVVEFLVDNTLGRLWFNATGGQTDLRYRCQYLLVKLDEQPQVATKLRDPRTLKLLDPACGSMHFGLYAFDLFAEIYREAWLWEQQHGPGSLDVSTQARTALKPLSQTYHDEVAFQRDVPRLIIENNIYGVDIDPRAAQIATLALWLRAQRAWHDASVKAKNRPRIGQGHILAAVAPPAERELRHQFAANLDKHDAELFEKTLLLLKHLPEMGVLLQAEQELHALIRQIYVGTGIGLFAQQEQETWQKAEARLREALTEFAQAEKSSYQGHLFAQDALQGLRLIDLSREKFDVIVMNPPFGEIPETSKSYLDKAYPNNEENILCCFIFRAIELLEAGGQVGFIIDKTVTIKSSYASVRDKLLENDHQVTSMLDLGWGVLDDAQVETVCMTVGSSSDSNITFFKPDTNILQLGGDLARSELNMEKAIIRPSSYFISVPNKAFAYDLPADLLSLFCNLGKLEPELGDARQGLGISDSWRWYRAISEIPIGACGQDKKYVRLTNGGGYSPFFRDSDLAIYWKNDGEAIKAAEAKLYGSWSRTVKNVSYYFHKGISFPKRTDHLNGHILPHGFIFTVEGLGFFPNSNINEEDNKVLEAVCLFNSRIQAFLINKFCGQHKHVGYVKSLPHPESGLLPQTLDYAQLAFRLKRIWASYLVNTSNFILPAVLSKNLPEKLSILGLRVNPLNIDQPKNIKEILSKLTSLVDSSNAALDDFMRLIDDDIFDVFGISTETRQLIKSETGSRPKLNIFQGVIESSTQNHSSWIYDLLDYLVGVSFGRWDIRCVTESHCDPDQTNIFEPLPACPPGMLHNSQGLPLAKDEFYKSKSIGKLNYPIDPAWGGVLVDDQNHPSDIVNHVHALLQHVFSERGIVENVEQELCEILQVNSLRAYFILSDRFFADHLQRYSKSRRKAPIYWPLATASGSYTLWIYYSSLNNQTLFTAVNDFLDGPYGKLTQVSRECAELRIKGSGRSRDEEKQYETLQTFEQELTDLRDTLLKIAPTYQPNHDDGVQITASPLWPLFRHKPWQKVLKDTWSKLEKGEYDWAHLAMAYWPERVREKCKTDKSIAIAHGLEDLYVEPEAVPKKTRGKKEK